MTDAKHRWLLERDADGEVRTYAEATEEAICDALSTGYAALYDTMDESCVWCIGEPERRIIEIRTFSEGRAVYGVVSTECSDICLTSIQVLDCLLNVPSNEVLTRSQAETVFQAFFHHKSFPSTFRIVAKSYLFGPST